MFSTVLAHVGHGPHLHAADFLLLAALALAMATSLVLQRQKAR